MALVNGGYLHCMDKEILVNLSLKATKIKELALVISKIQVSNPGQSWPSCLLCPSMDGSGHIVLACLSVCAFV